MKLVITLADGAEDDAARLLQWMRDHRWAASGEVVTIGAPHEAPVFAWRITGLEQEQA